MPLALGEGEGEGFEDLDGDDEDVSFSSAACAACHNSKEVHVASNNGLQLMRGWPQSSLAWSSCPGSIVFEAVWQ